VGRCLPSTFEAKYLKKPGDADPGSFVKLLGEGKPYFFACTIPEGLCMHRPDGGIDPMAETVTEILNFYFWTKNRLVYFVVKISKLGGIGVLWGLLPNFITRNRKYYYPKFCVMPNLKIPKGSGKKQGINKSSNL